jgi:hypothetical protein
MVNADIQYRLRLSEHWVAPPTEWCAIDRECCCAMNDLASRPGGQVVQIWKSITKRRNGQ